MNTPFVEEPIHDHTPTGHGNGNPNPVIGPG